MIFLGVGFHSLPLSRGLYHRISHLSNMIMLDVIQIILSVASIIISAIIVVMLSKRK